MASINDQFEYGRAPLKPLPYAYKDLAQCNEIIIDYKGDNPTYHIYIADSNDPKTLIDITNLIIKEMFPNAKINANQFQILIEGVKDPTSLKDIINFIYKRFTYPENPNGFNYDEDIDKVLDPSTKSVLLRNTDGTILLPVTTADNVFDKSGKSIEERLNNMTRVGFGIDYVRATSNNQTEFTFTYPFINYSDFVEIRIGTVYVDKTRYNITNNIDSNGNYTTATLKFIDPDYKIENGRRIDIIFIYNSLAISGGKYEYMYGGNIANGSIITSKLAKVSDSYTLNDSSAVASSAAVYKLFMAMVDSIDNNNGVSIWGIDRSSYDYFICNLNNISSNTIKDGSILTITNLNTKSHIIPNLHINLSNSSMTFSLLNLNNTQITSTIKSLPAGKTIRVLLDKTNHKAYLLSTNIFSAHKSRLIYTCRYEEEEIERYTISYHGLDYNIESIIEVYRNGVRLFEDIDYSIDKFNETITLFTNLNEGERIIFESLNS